MSDTNAVAHEHRMSPYYGVWAILLLFTAIEVGLAYQHLQPINMLTILLGLSLVKAALIILFFMHLRTEMTRMKVALMASLIICLSLMISFFSDAIRVVQLGPK